MGSWDRVSLSPHLSLGQPSAQGHPSSPVTGSFVRPTLLFASDSLVDRKGRLCSLWAGGGEGGGTGMPEALVLHPGTAEGSTWIG